MRTALFFLCLLCAPVMAGEGIHRHLTGRIYQNDWYLKHYDEIVQSSRAVFDHHRGRDKTIREYPENDDGYRTLKTRHFTLVWSHKAWRQLLSGSGGRIYRYKCTASWKGKGENRIRLIKLHEIIGYH